MASISKTLTTQDRSSLNTAFADPIRGGHAFDVIAASDSFIDVTLTPAQVFDLHNTPVEIVAAPGANKIIVCTQMMTKLDYNSAAYTGVGGSDIFRVRHTGGTDYFVSMAMIGTIDGTATKAGWGRGGVEAGTNSSDLLANTALEVYSPGDGVADGDSNVILRVFYKTFDLTKVGA